MQINASPNDMQAAGPQQMPDKDLSLYVAPQWKLIWWKFRKHRLAVFSAVVVLLILHCLVEKRF